MYATMLAHERKAIAYRPELNLWTGGVLQTIFLQQALYRWHHAGKRPFYKFNSPCQHKLYRPGDSWAEELGLTRRELETARSIAHKTTFKDHQDDLAKSLIVYWTEVNRVTYYLINEPGINVLLAAVYDTSPATLSALRNAQIVHYVMPDPVITLMHESGIMNTERSRDNIKNLSTERGAASSTSSSVGPGNGADEEKPEPKKPEPRGTGSKRPSTHSQLMAAYRKALGYAITNGAAEGKAAKQLLADGYDVAQVIACYEHLKAQKFWEKKHLSLASVRKQIGAFANNGAQQVAVPMPPAGVNVLNDDLNPGLIGENFDV